MLGVIRDLHDSCPVSLSKIFQFHRYSSKVRGADHQKSIIIAQLILILDKKL